MTDAWTEPLVPKSSREPSPSEAYEQQKDVNSKEESPAWVLAELQKQFWLAGPMICVNLLQYALNFVSITFVGHLGELALASAAIATSLAGVTGFGLLLHYKKFSYRRSLAGLKLQSLVVRDSQDTQFISCCIVGMASALETLCGQAYGAKQYHLLGTYLQRAIVVLNTASIPIAFIWLNLSSLLQAFGQDPEISEYAGVYIRWMLPSLFAIATLQPLVKFLQTQSAVLPMALCSAFTLCIHIPVCWLLVYKSGVGYRGAAMANALNSWLNVALLVLYVKFGPTCKKTWVGFTTEAFHDMKPFFKLAIPSTAMICLENWSFEVMLLASGLLPNPKMETSALTIGSNTIAVLWMIPVGIGASVSTRVSNELGAGRASAAKKAVAVGVSLGLTQGLIMSSVAFSARHVWAYAFTNELEVVDYVATVIPFLAVLTTLDSIQTVLSGVTRGCGNQRLGAYTNLGAYYVVGIPLALTLAFHYHLNGKGLWLGMIAALAVQGLSLFLIAFYTNWEKQAQEALDRMYTDGLPSQRIEVQKDDSESPLLQ